MIHTTMICLRKNAFVFLFGLVLSATMPSAKALEYTFYDLLNVDPLAVLELSGSEPFTHSNVQSLTITPEGAVAFPGLIAGTYPGTFTSSTGSVIADLSMIGLVANGPTDVEFNSIDAPDISSGFSGTLDLGFEAGDFFQDYIRYSDSQTESFMYGSWIGTSVPVPEPSTCILLAGGSLLLALRYRHSRSKV